MKTGRSGHLTWVDEYVGRQIRVRRTALGMSQEALGNRVGLTFQQIQKYEKGVNGVSPTRLFDIAKVLDVPTSYFYPEQTATEAPDNIVLDSEEHQIVGVLRAASPEKRKAILGFFRTAAILADAGAAA